MTDPVTAPDMESIIAGVLFGHALETWTVGPETGLIIQCVCGEGSIVVVTEPDTDAMDDHAAEWIAAHQARAVLAAISEAGAVELTYGLQHANGFVFECRDLAEAKALKDGTKIHGRRGDWANHTIVTKQKISTTFPWERAE